MDEMPGLSSALLASMGQRIRDDAADLSATLQHVGAVGLEDVAAALFAARTSDAGHHPPSRCCGRVARHRSWTLSLIRFPMTMTCG